jgi:two-component system phosphate regulon sensor histidine kinase PhoR
MTCRANIFVTALACSVVAAIAAILFLASLHPSSVSAITAVLALAAAIATAAAVAWTLSVPLARRVNALDDRARALEALGRDLPLRLANLEADRARLAAILGGMIEGVLVVNEHGRLQLANDAARRMLRMEDAAEGRHYPEIVRHPAVASQIASALAGGSTETVEIAGLRDPQMTLLARAAAVNVAKGRGAVVVLHDISDLRRADQMRRDFVANVSHELRTPLTAIRGYAEALTDATPEESRRFLEVLMRHTRRMESLVRDLLRLARLDARQETLERTECSVAALARAVESDLAAVLSARGQRLDVEIAAEASTVVADGAKMQDVLRNLIENASNHSPQGASVLVRAWRERGGTALAIEDRGPGIPAADLTRIFERFYRVDKSRARSDRDPGGTGLGLAIAKHLLELHGATIDAANAPEGGAVFTIHLPD